MRASFGCKNSGKQYTILYSSKWGTPPADKGAWAEMTSIFDQSLFDDNYRKEREKALLISRILFWIIVIISFVMGYICGLMQP